MILNSGLVKKIEIDEIEKNFVKSMGVKKFNYLGQFIPDLKRLSWIIWGSKKSTHLGIDRGIKYISYDLEN